ncbi:uroporphyrinogen-III synthase [Xylanibacter brevis]|uniref:uroporphyrinogen-III synthase n=2 Tax=Xylanibacter brevis TaxID=83231 RepID=UPI0004853C1A|nr:uroporphyrinogen-III synthase [Xylanibacter brevis]
MKTLFTGLTSPNKDFIHTPLIEIVPVDDRSALQRAADNISNYDYVLFTSRYAAKYVGKLFAQARQIVSIGSTTTAALQQSGIEAMSEVEEDNSYGVIEWFRHQPCGRVLIPRSNLALPIIPEGLRELGFEVECVTAYVNRMPEHAEKVNLSEVERIVFTSPSTIDNFIRLYGFIPTDKQLETRGPITEQHLQKRIKQQQL